MRPNRVFFLESGNLALDLLNTRGDSGDPEEEQLRSPMDLTAWLSTACVRAELGTSARRDQLAADGAPAPPAARILLTEARRLRDDTARLVDSITSGSPPPAHVLYGINRVLDASRSSSTVLADTRGARLVEEERGVSLLVSLAPVARAAAELLISADPGRIRLCLSPRCHRWFLDTSKGGRRKWCSMATCGNRAKAANHRRRHTQA